MARRRILIPCVAALLLTGCWETFPRNEPGKTYGTIYVGSPRVEGRERLINDQLDQEQWLQKRLTIIRDAEYGVSGAVALTSSSFLNAQANLSLDPKYGLDALARARQTQAGKSALDDDRAIAAFRSAARDEIIAKYNKKEYTQQQASDALAALGYSVAASSSSSSASSAPGAATAPNSTYLNSAAAARLDASTANAQRAQLSGTPIEDFTDRLAAAEVVRNELNDVRLDDLHDLAGNTLYRLTFDASVNPANDTSAWAVIRVKVPLNSNVVDTSDLLSRASAQYIRTLSDSNEVSFRTLLNNIKRECYRQELERTGLLLDDEEMLAFRRVFLCASKDMGSATRRQLEGQLSRLSAEKIVEFDKSGSHPLGIEGPTAEVRQLRSNEQDLLLAAPEPKENVATFADRKRRLRKWAQWAAVVYDGHALAEFLQSPLSCYKSLTFNAALGGPFPYSLGSAPSSSPDALPTCPTSGSGESAFQQELIRRMTASVYAVTPKESVQRLSEVSSNRKTTELLLGLSAVASSAGLNAAIQSIKSNTAMYEAIRRQPLVVGFTERGNSCKKTLVQDETPISGPQPSGAASVGQALSASAPSTQASQPKIMLTAPCGQELVFGWILGPSFVLSKDGKNSQFRHTASQKSVAATISLPAWLNSLQVEVETSWVPETGTAPLVSGTSMSYAIHLPATPIDALATLDRGAARVPRVDRYQFLDVDEGEPATVLITGRDLWRSTQVFIGAQRATSLSVLPTYRGIAATFEKIGAPLGSVRSLGYDQGYDLTVYTSEGSTVAGHVNVKRKDAGAQAPQQVTGAVPRILAGVETGIAVTNGLSVTDEPVVVVTTPRDVSFVLNLTDSTSLNQDRKSILFTLPSKSVPTLKTGDTVSTSLSVKHGKTGGTEVFPIQKSAVYYLTEDDSKAKVSTNSKPGPSIQLAIKFPVKASLAFDSLKEDRAKVVARAKTEDGKEFTLNGDCVISKAGACDVKLEGPSAWTAAAAKAKQVDLTIALVGKDVPGFVSDALTLK